MRNEVLQSGLEQEPWTIATTSLLMADIAFDEGHYMETRAIEKRAVSEVNMDNLSINLHFLSRLPEVLTLNAQMFLNKESDDPNSLKKISSKIHSSTEDSKKLLSVWSQIFAKRCLQQRLFDSIEDPARSLASRSNKNEDLSNLATLLSVAEPSSTHISDRIVRILRSYGLNHPKYYEMLHCEIHIAMSILALDGNKDDAKDPLSYLCGAYQLAGAEIPEPKSLVLNIEKAAQ